MEVKVSNYYKDCTIVIKNNVATLNEHLYLYKYDKNVELYFTIVDKQYNLKPQNVLRKVDADFAQVKWMKTDGKIKKIFPIFSFNFELSILSGMSIKEDNTL